MIGLLALRNLVLRPWRTAFLLLGYALGVSVMIVLLSIGEALLGEMSDTARVLFPVDANSASAALRSVYAGRGQVACLIVSKRDMPHRLAGDDARRFVTQGAAHIDGDPNAMAIIEVNSNPSVRLLEESNRGDLILKIWHHTFSAMGLL